MKLVKNIFIIGLVVLVILYFGISLYFARSIVKPDVMTLEEEKNWEKEHRMWNGFDTFQKTSYIVKGENKYELNVELIKAEDSSSKKYVIISHGFKSNRNGSVKYVDAYRKLGYNCIIYDVRGHGINKKATVSLGNFESKDLLYLIEDTYSRYGKEVYVGLHGESMGSSISLSVLKYQPKVKFVVADCGFTNLYDLIETGYSNYHIGFMIHGVNFITKYIYGVDMKETSPIDALKTNNNIPITFIHGKDDKFISYKNSEELLKASKNINNLFLIKDAGHAMSREVLGTDKYIELLKNNPNIT